MQSEHPWKLVVEATDRNMKSANHLQTIFPNICSGETKRTRAPNYSSFFSERYSPPCWIQQFHLCQILITPLSWKPDTVKGEEGKNSIDVNEQTPHLRDFLSWGRNSWPDCFGVVSVEPRGVCKPCEWWRWWGCESAFQTGSCKSTFNHLVWAWLQRGGGRGGVTSDGSGVRTCSN